jgi:hypothetical protein
MKDGARRLARGRIDLLIRDKEQAAKLTDLLSPNIDERISLDQAEYAKVIAACNGLTPKENAANLSKIVIDYDQNLLTLEDMALELGCEPEILRKALTAGRNLDPCLTGVLQDPQEAARRDQWNYAGYSQAALLLMAQKGVIKK